MPPMRAPSQALSRASESVHCCFALWPHFGATSHSSTMLTSYAGTGPHPPSAHSLLDWTRPAPKKDDSPLSAIAALNPFWLEVLLFLLHVRRHGTIEVAERRGEVARSKIDRIVLCFRRV